MKNWKYSILLILLTFVSTSLFSQNNSLQSSPPLAVPDKTLESLKAIYEDNEFSVRNFRADWLPHGSGYFRLENIPGESKNALVSYDAETGKKKEFLSSSQLVLPNENKSFRIDSYEFSPDGRYLLI